MVLDSSAVVAIVLGESEATDFLAKMDAAPRLLFSAASLVETGVVLMRGGDGWAESRLDVFLGRAGVRIVPVDMGQAVIARDAYRIYGKGRHRAGLNFGDCFSYALAMQTGEALLFKGDDFGQTDVLVA